MFRLYWKVVEKDENHESLTIFFNFFRWLGVKFALKMSKTEALKKIGAQLTPELFPGCESHGNSNDDNDAYWECYIRHVTQTMWLVYLISFNCITFHSKFFFALKSRHYSSTVRMGFPLATNTAVDATLR